jgi:hypothetical protein
MSFSENGNYLIANYGQYRDAETRVKFDGVIVFDLVEWKLVMDYVSRGEIGPVYTCADPDVVVVSENRYPDDATFRLKFRSLSTTESFATIEMDMPPGQTPDSGLYHCDLRENIMYMAILQDKVTALDGSTGDVVREYLAEDVGEYAPFVVQKEEDRLVRIDMYNDVVWIYRLSTADLLGRIDLWPHIRDGRSTDYSFIGPEKILYGLFGDNDAGCIGVQFVLADLSGFTASELYCVEGYMYDGFMPMDDRIDNILLLAHIPNSYCYEIRSVDLESGTDDLWFDLCELGNGGLMAIPETDTVLLADWEPEGEVGEHFYFYSYPEFELKDDFLSPVTYEEVQFVNSKNILLLESAFSDYFAVYDLLQNTLLDDFRLCENVFENSLRVDPFDNWAAVRCGGKDPDEEIGPGVFPADSGMRVVDLRNYD